MFSFPEFLLSYSTSTPALFACLNFPSKTKLLMFVFLTNLINIGVILYFITSMDNPFFPRSIYLPADFTSFLQFLPRQALGCPKPGWSTWESVPAMAWDMDGLQSAFNPNHSGIPWAALWAPGAGGTWLSQCQVLGYKSCSSSCKKPAAEQQLLISLSPTEFKMYGISCSSTWARDGNQTILTWWIPEKCHSVLSVIYSLVLRH